MQRPLPFGWPGGYENFDGDLVSYADEASDIRHRDIEVGPDEGCAPEDVYYVAVIPGLDLEDDGGLDAFDFELTGYLYGDLLAVGEALGRGRESGRVKVAMGSLGNILSRM